jgi:TPR repeat protein
MRCPGYHRLIWCCSLAAAVGLAAVGYGQQPKPTVEKLREAAEKGDTKAQTDLAYRLWNGDGVAADKAEAINLFRRAADKGYARAQYALGFRMARGQGMPKDLAQAAEWYARSAALGYAPGMREAAVAFALGRGLPADPAEAVKRLDAVLAKTPALLKSATVTAERKVEFFRYMTTAYFRLSQSQDRKAAYDKVRAVLDKHAAGTALFYAVRGDFYVTYAWDARTAQLASKVTDEQFRVFFERLEVAAEALEKAWELDDKSAHVAARRITVAMGLHEERPVVERWFERAVKADPNNLAAYQAKLVYLEPKWHGDDQGRDVLEFARECVKGGNWKARVPFLLIQAHEELSEYPRGDRTEWADKPDPRYFAQPDVWADVKSVYEPYLKLNPDAYADRSKYAMLAAWAGEWAVADAQFRQLGEKVVVSVFDSPAELDRLRREAASKGP